MKTLFSIIFLIQSLLTFGQLFPNVPDFKGKIEMVVEKKLGREVSFLNLFKKTYRSDKLSGWRCIYRFDSHSNLIRRTNNFQGKIKADFLYQRDTIGNRFIEREIIADNLNGNQGDYIEYENFKDPKGHIEKVNFWAFDAQEDTRVLFQVDQNAEYSDDKLITFTRYRVAKNGDLGSGEKFDFFYDSSGKLTRIVRTGSDTGFKTEFKYQNNNKGLVDHFSVDFLAELQEYGTKEQLQNVYYKYDSRGNWISMFRKTGKKIMVEAKREIKYR